MHKKQQLGWRGRVPGGGGERRAHVLLRENKHVLLQRRRVHHHGHSRSHGEASREARGQGRLLDHCRRPMSHPCTKSRRMLRRLGRLRRLLLLLLLALLLLLLLALLLLLLLALLLALRLPLGDERRSHQGVEILHSCLAWAAPGLFNLLQFREQRIHECGILLPSRELTFGSSPALPSALVIPIPVGAWSAVGGGFRLPARSAVGSWALFCLKTRRADKFANDQLGRPSSVHGSYGCGRPTTACTHLGEMRRIFFL